MSVKSRIKFDYVLLGIVILLCVFGLIMLTSAGSALGFQRFGDSYFFVKRQFLSFLIGIGLLLLTTNIDYKIYKKWALPILGISIFLLVIVLIPGVGTTLLGGSRWINIGGFVFQPSEIVKLTFLIYLSAWLETKTTQSKDSSGHIYQFIALLVIVGGLIVLQPDMGTMSIVAIVSGVIFFVSGANLKQIAWLISGAFGFFLILIKTAPYRAARLTAFLDPSADSRGIGYHIQQALIAIGTGGLLGVGLGKSRQKFNYLPEAATDSIFAVIAEELGFLAVLALVSLFVALFIRGIRIARSAPDKFSKLLVTGIISWITLQAFINIAALSSIVPLTGIPLPFISFGGSGLIITLAGVGIMLNVSKNAK